MQYDLRQKQTVRNGRGNKEGLFAAPIRTESYNVMEGETLMSIDKSNDTMVNYTVLVLQMA